MKKEGARHVIFLGAGASHSSGYPIGEKLRLRLSSETQFAADLDKNFPKDKHGMKWHNGDETARACLGYFRHFKSAIDLFRHGGFATVDEFSKLAAKNYPEHTQNMKKLMRLAFAFHNPEDTFQDSDYYPCIQKLFENDLHSLKSNVTILSYNYDCYLDFLLLKAYEHRKQLSPESEISEFDKNRLTSGFFEPKKTDWAQQTLMFNYFKLHGSIAYAHDNPFTHRQLFRADIHSRLNPFGGSDYQKLVPPIVFPWELFNNRGEFLKEGEFIFVKEAKNDEQPAAAKILFNLYKAIWEGAKDAVQRAEKVSFVGMSMHSFLENGLGHLFRDKAGKIKVVVANISDVDRVCMRLGDTLRRIAPQMHAQGDWIDPKSHQMDTDGKIKYMNYGMTQRASFKEFIEKDMD